MLTDALAVIDRLIQLLTQRQDNRRQLFNQHIEPIFLDISLIQADYRSGFEAVLRIVDEGRSSTQELGELIRQEKAKMEHLRVKVHALIAAWNEQVQVRSIPEPAQDFFQACWRYFAGAANMDDDYRAHYTDLLAKLAKIRADGAENGRSEVTRQLVVARNELNSDWSAVTAAYAAARINLLK